ncbi:hypothetical protein [Parapedobacter tibetensis]|uniref:hypothetical protein n=1 Tax=Parapedobacter tibetensis TaxID=2972951 RepID=UPI00214DA052|nr:hypothetical protein [Parapedobacter tibetensis]
MKELFNIEKLIARILCILITLLLSVLFVTPISANPIDCEQTCRSYSFINTKTAKKTSFEVTENGLANCCQNKQDLVDYRNWGVGIEAGAAKAGKKFRCYKKSPWYIT